MKHLPDVDCDWLLALDHHREPEVWIDVLSTLAEGRGRLVRIRPWRHRTRGNEQVAWLSRFLIDGCAEWTRWLNRRSVRMIELGRAWHPDAQGRLRASHGFTVYQAYDRAEVARLLQSSLPGDAAQFPATAPSRPSRTITTRRGRRSPRTNADQGPK